MVKQFEKETKMKLKQVDTNKYYEISGKSVTYINEKIKQFNKVHNTTVKYINDDIKDVTIIYF